ncbi:unnamed protein product [Owenia fusiformis]|uniref:Uncharacterized protein n=1 Tax=Owenia fusiformis TaxID=6347 RepID=A0A8J1XUY8_OWEFU|nr:unnamed protein product [Owenia fusiformis]
MADKQTPSGTSIDSRTSVDSQDIPLTRPRKSRSTINLNAAALLTESDIAIINGSSDAASASETSLNQHSIDDLAMGKPTGALALKKSRSSTIHKYGLPKKDTSIVLDGRDRHSRDTTFNRGPMNGGPSPRQSISDASMSSYRGMSPDPDQHSRSSTPASFRSTSTRRAGSGTPDIRSFLIEKRLNEEVIESQLRKLQVENSSLTTENKLLKEKYNRAQSKISSLESHLLNAQSEASHIQDSLSHEVTEFKRHSRSESEKERQNLDRRVAALTVETERLRFESTSLERQLEAAKKAADTVRSVSDKARVIDVYKIEVESLKEEIKKVKLLLQQCEGDRQIEVEHRKESAQQVIKLAEMKNLLQQQVEMNGSHMAAEKQVRSLEKRLKITEERLHQERADRAGKLSQLEDKLINENARLQVAEKESKRQLLREKDRTKNLEHKIKHLKDECDRLMEEVPDRRSPGLLSIYGSAENGYKGRWSSIVHDNRKVSEQYEMIKDTLQRDEGIKPSKEQDIVVCMWVRKQQAVKALTEVENQLKELGIERNIKDNLKKLGTDKASMESRLAQLQEALDDNTQAKVELEKTYSSKIGGIIEEKHQLSAMVKNLEDKLRGLQVENDSLKHSVVSGSGRSTPKGVNSSGHYEVQIEKLTNDNRTLTADLHQQIRNIKLLEGELETVKSQLAAKHQSLEEALDELDKATNRRLTDDDVNDQRQIRIDHLTAECQGLRAEAKLWQDKCSNAKLEQSQLEERLEILTTKIRSYEEKIRKESSSFGSFESQKLELENEVHEKEIHISKVTAQYKETEDELQRAKHKLLLEQEASAQLAEEMENLQTDLRQGARVVERLQGTEQTYKTEIMSLKENLDAANRDLTQRTSEIQLLNIELNRHKELVTKYQHDLDQKESMIQKQRQELLSEGRRSTEAYSDHRVRQEHLGELERKIQALEADKSTLQHELSKTNPNIERVVRENAELMGQMRELKQHLVGEQANICQLNKDKDDIHQKLQMAIEERESYKREKEILEVDLAKRQATMGETLCKLELDSKKARVDYEANYKNLSADGKRLASELETTKRLLEAKEREIDFLNDTIGRQKQESESLNRKIELLHDENAQNRNDLEKITNDLTTKMKELGSAKDVNQQLIRERSELQFVKSQLESEVNKEKNELNKSRDEYDSTHRKLENEQETLKTTEKLLHEKETQVVALTTELTHVNKHAATLETECDTLKQRCEKLHDDMLNLTNVNTALEHKLSVEKSSLTEERTNVGVTKDSLNECQQKLDNLRQEYEILASSLDMEKKSVASLKDKCQVEEATQMKLEERFRGVQVENETLRAQLKATREQNDQLKKDKQNLNSDMQEIVGKLSEKESLVNQLQEKCNHTVESVQREYALEKTHITKEKESVEERCCRLETEKQELNENIKQKDTQLEAFGRTLRELEEETKSRESLETKTQTLQSDIKECQEVINNLRTENVTLLEREKHLMDCQENDKETITDLRAQIVNQQDVVEEKLSTLRMELTSTGSKWDGEKSELRDKLNKATAELKANEVALSSLRDTKEHFHTTNKSLEKTLDALKVELNEANTNWKLSEQRVDTLKTQLDELRIKKLEDEEKIASLKTSIAKQESDLNVEREASRKLQEVHRELEGTCSAQESHSQVLQDQISAMQGELSNLKQKLTTQKQTLTSKNRSISLELKQHSDAFEKDRNKLLLQAQQLSVDLEQAREQVAKKNRENLKLHEEVLAIEERMRETCTELKQYRDSLQVERDTQEQLNKKNQELEMEVNRLKLAMMSKHEDDLDSSDLASKADVSRMLTEITLQLRNQMNGTQGTDSVDSKLIEQYKAKISELESKLASETAMLDVMRRQLQQVDDDNTRLRQQLLSKRKINTGSDSNKRSRSRMEEIGEIIMRSQSRAAAMLSAGQFTIDGDPLQTMTPSRDFNASLPMFASPNLEAQMNDFNGSLPFTSNNMFRPLHTATPTSGQKPAN